MAVSTAQAAPLDRLEVETASGAHVFTVEVMHTESEKEMGLMYRRSMAPDRGMLFDYSATDAPVQFWMHNTYIPLDMIFIGKDGHVVSVARDAKPMDDTVIGSGAPTAGVLELNAGASEKMGLKVGDVVKHPIFGDVATTH